MLEVFAEHRQEIRKGFYIFRKYDCAIEVEQLDLSHNRLNIYYRDDFERCWSSTSDYLTDEKLIIELNSLSEIIFPHNVIYLPPRFFENHYSE